MEEKIVVEGAVNAAEAVAEKLPNNKIKFIALGAVAGIAAATGTILLIKKRKAAKKAKEEVVADFGEVVDTVEETEE